MLLCTGGEPWGQPPERVKQQLGFRAKMRGCKGQVATASLSLSEGWMLLKLLSLCRGRRAMSPCQRNGWEKSVKKEITSKKATKWVGSWPGSLRQMALLVTTAATENPGETGVADKYLKIATSCWAQTISPSLPRRESFAQGLLYLLFIISWQRCYLDTARRIKLLNVSSVLSCSKILKSWWICSLLSISFLKQVRCCMLIHLALQPDGLLLRFWQSGCNSSGRVGREKWPCVMCRALPHWVLLPGPLLAPFASQMQLMLQSCPLKPALSSAWSLLLLHAVWPRKLGQSSLAFPLPLAGAQLAKEAGLLWEQRHSSVTTLTRRFSLLINLASASGNPLPLGTLYFYSQLEIGA